MASLLALGQKGALGHLIERNLLSGIADASGRCLGLGIIERIDFARRTIVLSTPVERDRVRIVQFGDLYVTPEGGELRQVKWAW